MTELTVHQANEIAQKVIARQAAHDEDLHTSVMVALLNYGDHLTPVHCIAGEWSGTKGDLVPSSGVPVCPSGHVLVQVMQRYRLGVVEVD